MVKVKAGQPGGHRMGSGGGGAPFQRLSNKPLRQQGLRAKAHRQSYPMMSYRHGVGDGYDGQENMLPNYPRPYYHNPKETEVLEEHAVLNQLYPNAQVNISPDPRLARIVKKHEAEFEGLALRDFIHRNVNWADGVEVNELAKKGILGDKFSAQQNLLENLIALIRKTYDIVSGGKINMDMSDWEFAKQVVAGEIIVPDIVWKAIDPDELARAFGERPLGGAFQMGMLNPYRWHRWTTSSNRKNNVFFNMFSAGGVQDQGFHNGSLMNPLRGPRALGQVWTGNAGPAGGYGPVGENIPLPVGV